MSQILVYLKWELKLVFRTGGSIINGLSFFTIFILLTPLGMTVNISALSNIAPTILWIGSLLAVVITLDRFFLLDLEDGSLDFLNLLPLPLETIVLVKMIVHWLTTGLPLAILSPIFAFTLNLPQSSYGWLVLSLLLGTPALSFIGAVGASLTIGLRRGSLLLSIIVIPLYFPTLIFGTKVIQLAVNNENPLSALTFLIATTLFSLAISPFISALAIRTHWKY